MDSRTTLVTPEQPLQYDQSGLAGGYERPGASAMPMDAPPSIPAGGSAASGAFLYEPSGRQVSISIEFDVIDRLNFDIMKGYGAVPKRGAEVGGILLGTAELGDRLVVRIEDFVTVPCEHLRGPSYILSDSDIARFVEALDQWAPAPDKRIHAVGFFRSNTRGEFQLGPEDRGLMEGRFANAAVCLLVRPYATRIGEAAYLWSEGGSIPEKPNGEIFPFRRKELGGGPRPKRAAPGQNGQTELSYDTGFTAPDESGGQHGGLAGSAVAGAIVDVAAPSFGGLADLPVVDSGPTEASSSAAKEKGQGAPGWVWIPLSFVFLLLGVVLGFQISMTFNKPPAPAKQLDPYALGVSVARLGDSLLVKWNLDAPAVQKAQRAVLTIFDGDTRKTVDLGLDDLARGGVLYRNFNQTARFRLEVFHSDARTVTESAEIKVVEDR
jgi:hypothetical protein